MKPVGEQAREPEQANINTVKQWITAYIKERWDEWMTLGMDEEAFWAKMLIAYAAHCREAEQQEDASDYFDLLRRAEAAEASLRSAKADALREAAEALSPANWKYVDNGASMRLTQICEWLKMRANELSVPSAPTAKEE